MTNAVIIVSMESSYIEKKCTDLGFITYSIDRYSHGNYSLLDNPKKLEVYINKIKSDFSDVILIYGSGLEGKKSAQKVLSQNFDIKGNSFINFNRLNNLTNIQDIILESGLKLPKYKKSMSKESGKYLSKPYNSFGGYNISFDKNNDINFYYEEYIIGETYSVSFFSGKSNFFLLGFNKLLLLKNYKPHPFIHAGAYTFMLHNSDSIIKKIELLADKLSLEGYNSIDFKIFNEEIYLLDINPRITSTFKMYNNFYNNGLLQIQMGIANIEILKKFEKNREYYGFAHMFASEDLLYQNDFTNNSYFSSVPKYNDFIKKDDPFLTINVTGRSFQEMISLLKEKISITTNHYSCYDIDI